MSKAALGCTGSGALLLKRCRVPNLSSAETKWGVIQRAQRRRGFQSRDIDKVDGVGDASPPFWGLRGQLSNGTGSTRAPRKTARSRSHAGSPTPTTAETVQVQRCNRNTNN